MVCCCKKSIISCNITGCGGVRWRPRAASPRDLQTGPPPPPVRSSGCPWRPCGHGWTTSRGGTSYACATWRTLAPRMANQTPATTPLMTPPSLRARTVPNPPSGRAAPMPAATWPTVRSPSRTGPAPRRACAVLARAWQWHVTGHPRGHHRPRQHARQRAGRTSGRRRARSCVHGQAATRALSASSPAQPT